MKIRIYQRHGKRVPASKFTLLLSEDGTVGTSKALYEKFGYVDDISRVYKFQAKSWGTVTGTTLYRGLAEHLNKPTFWQRIRGKVE